MTKDSLKIGHLLALAAVLAAAAFAQWLERGPQEPTPLERVRGGGRLLAGYALEPPFVLIDKQGQVSGEAPEVFRRVLAAIGPARIEWVHADFASLRHELEAGRIDVIVAGMFVTPERSRELLFSRPTAFVCAGFAVPAGNPAGLRGYGDVARAPGRRLGVIAGAFEEADARAAGVAPSRLVAFPDALSGIAAVKSGRVDAFALSAVSLRRELVPGGPLELVAPLEAERPPPPGRPAFAFRPADRELRDAIDGALAGWLGSAEHRELVQPFGFTAVELRDRGADARCYP